MERLELRQRAVNPAGQVRGVGERQPRPRFPQTSTTSLKAGHRFADRVSPRTDGSLGTLQHAIRQPSQTVLVSVPRLELGDSVLQMPSAGGEITAEAMTMAQAQVGIGRFGRQTDGPSQGGGSGVTQLRSVRPKEVEKQVAFGQP